MAASGTAKTAATTSSTCTPETEHGKHVFRITGYSLHKGLGAGNFIRSATFSVAGYDWCIRFYPDGYSEHKGSDCVSVYLELMSKEAMVMALYSLRLVNRATGLSSMEFCGVSSPRKFSSPKGIRTWGSSKFMKRSELEASPYLWDDCLVIECDVTVVKEPRVEETTIRPVEVQVPPSDMLDNLTKLLGSEEEADVTFSVKGEVFPGHKIVLAMRSPVFKAELYGPMRDKTKRNIPVEDMQPAVFRALLHFIYTDSLPSMDDLDGEEKDGMVTHLLVAADRYAMERMKLMCESILCKTLDVERVANTLALADQHNCSNLKDACLQFIASANRMDAVVASQGYAHLKRSSPAVIVEVLERATKSRKFNMLTLG